MARYVSHIGSLFENWWPDPSSIKHFFFEYSEDKWAYGGASGASFFAYGVDGTDGAEPYTERIDISLAIWDDPKLGFCLFHSKTGGGFGEHFFSLKDENDLTAVVEDRIGGISARGLFISPEEAWMALEDFLKTGGKRSTRIRWISDGDLGAKQKQQGLDSV